MRGAGWVRGTISAVRSRTRLGILMVASALVAGVLALATRDAPASSASGPSDATSTTSPTTSSSTATTATGEPLPPTAGLRLEKVRTITATGETGPLSPKSIVASGTGVRRRSSSTPRT
jgi:hypothetical protein